MTGSLLLATVRPVPRVIKAHEQVAEYYRQLIRTGVLRRGDEMRPVRVLAEEWGDISTKTVQLALRLLGDEGWLDVGHGRKARVVGMPETPP